jgi:hypothetical protein
MDIYDDETLVDRFLEVQARDIATEWGTPRRWRSIKAHLRDMVASGDFIVEVEPDRLRWWPASRH